MEVLSSNFEISSTLNSAKGLHLTKYFTT